MNKSITWQRMSLSANSKFDTLSCKDLFKTKVIIFVLFLQIKSTFMIFFPNRQPTPVPPPMFVLYKLHKSGSPSGQTSPEKRPGRKLELETLNFTEFTLLCLVVIHAWSMTSAPRSSCKLKFKNVGWALGVRIASPFSIHWERPVSGNRGLDLLVSGMYIPKFNLEKYSQHAGIWEANTSIKQRISTRKTGKSTWYLRWEYSSPPSGHI